MGSLGRDRCEGFTLVELLVVVAIIGILAAIAVSGLVSAVQRGRQSRTMADIRSLGTAIHAYEVDYAMFPRVTGNANQLKVCLQPTYLKTLPVNDGWNQPLNYTSDGQGYTVLSLGSDFVAEDSYVEGPTHHFWQDIVFRNGQFYQWPEGAQASGDAGRQMD